MNNYFLSNVNRSISDNMRFTRQFQASTSNGGASGSTNSAANNAQAMLAQMMNGLNPLTLMMMLWMMQGGGSQGSMGVPGVGYPGTWLPGYGVPGGFYPPIFTPTTPAYPFWPSEPVNPAASYLDKLFKANTPEPTDDSKKPETVLDDTDITQVRKDLADGKIKAADLLQALQTKLSQAPDRQQKAVSKLITDLSDSGDLNITPFLANNYLKTLPESRRENLLVAVKLSGLRMDDGKANSQFIGFLLQNLNAKDKPETRNFLREFLQDFYDVHGKTADTPVGKILAQVIDLASLTADKDGKLQFAMV